MSKEKSVSGYIWEQIKYDDELSEKISIQNDLPKSISKILSSRVKDINKVEDFLNPKLKNDMVDPFLFKGMSDAVDRTITAIKENEPIGIFGDYDVDGITSSSILYNYIKKAIDPKYPVFGYIPDREKDGYGMNNNAIDKLKEQGSSLIITVDCGITNFDEVDYANSQNLEVIIIDHHEAKNELPNAIACVNPKRKDDRTGLEYLAAVGVVFFFIVALNKKLKEQNIISGNYNLLNLLDLVALGTVCDSVPLIGINRSLVQTGIEVMQKNANMGVETLLEVANANSKISVYTLGFIIGPRINAGGRVGDSFLGFRLLTTGSQIVAEEIALKLNELNLKRREMEALVLAQAEEQINEDLLKEKFILIKGDNWHHGVIGIVAGRLKEKYNLPTLVATKQEDGLFNGSARSVENFNIGQVIIDAKENDILKEGGGHMMAAGFSFTSSQENEFKKTIRKSVNEFLKNNNFNRKILISDSLNPLSCNIDFARLINRLGPFGMKNEEPKFIIENLRLKNYTLLQKGVIICNFSSDSGAKVNGIIFSSTNDIIREKIKNGIGQIFNILGKLSLSMYRGKENLKVIIEDISTSN